ncbi:MAG: hypothetical protein R3F19_33175 [Verrucomicrobiales bacterium]
MNSGTKLRLTRRAGIVGILATLLMLIVGWIARLYWVDADKPAPPPWAKPVIRESAAVEAMQHLYAIDTTKFESIPEDERTAMSLGAVEREPVDDWTAIRKVVEDNVDLLAQLHTFVSEHDKLTFAPETDLRTSATSPTDRPLQFITLLKIEMGMAAYEGRIDDAIDSALTALQLGRLLCQGDGTVVQFLTANTVFQVSLVNVNYLISKIDDSNRLRYLAKELEGITVDNSAFVSALIAELEFSDAVHGQDFDLREIKDSTTTLGFADCSDRWFWVWPERFYKENISKSQTIESYSEMVRNSTRPTKDWTEHELRKFEEVEGHPILKQLHPNAVGCLTGWQSYVLFQIIHERFRRSQLVQRLICMSAAARAFEIETGALPDSLEDLVPDYIDQVPMDPWYKTKPISYRKAARVIYGVGASGYAIGKPTPQPFEDPDNPAVVIPDGSTTKP